MGKPRGVNHRDPSRLEVGIMKMVIVIDTTGQDDTASVHAVKELVYHNESLFKMASMFEIPERGSLIGELMFLLSHAPHLGDASNE